MNEICNLRFFNYLNESFIMLDMKGNIIETNEYTQKLFGYNLEQLKEKNIEELIPLKDIKIEIFKNNFTSKKIPIKTKKGIRFFTIKSMKIWQRCVERDYILMFIKDIEAEEKYKILFNNSIQGIFQSTPEGKYINVNQAYVDLLGYSNYKELIESINDIKNQVYANPDERDIFLEYMKEYNEIRNFEGQMKKKNGDKIWVSISANCVKDDLGKILYIEGIVEDITEKKESFVNYKSLLNAIPDMMARIRFDGLILDIKPGEGQFSEKGQSDIFIGLYIKDLPFPESIINDFEKTIINVIEHNEPKIYKYSIPIAGKKRYYYSRTVKNGENEVIVIVRDITEETKISTDLKNSKDFAENLLATANVMIVGLDLNGNVNIFNETSEIQTGYKKEEVLGKNWFNEIHIISKNDIERLNKIFQKLINDDSFKNNENENIIITKHGEIKYILWRNNQIKENNEIKGTISFGLDISDRKKHVEELLEAKGISEKSEKRYKDLIETLQEGIWKIDKNAKTTFVNDRMCDMLGYSFDEMLGKSLFDFTDEDGVKLANENLERRKKGIFEQHDFKFIRKDGSKIYTTLETGPITDNDGNYIGAIAGIIDISDRKKFEEQLIEARNKAEKSDQMKLEFLANMSHDLRTPMNSIIGFSDLLKSNNITKQEKNEYINIIINNGKFLMALIDDIIDISKIDSGSLKIDIVDFELNKLMEELRLSYTKQIKDKNIELIIDVDVNKNIIIHSDKYRMRQILMNLIGNAIKFTHDGYVKFGYKILNSKQLEVYVEDTGIGIERQYQKIIFERFKQIGMSSKFKGAGLGLSITKSLVELLGFKEVKLISELDKGSKFYFIVPYTIKPYNYISDLKNHKKQKRTNFLGKTILIIEDNEESRTIIKSYLLNTQANILELNDGNRIVNYLKENHVDLILLDIGLPGKDGYQVLEEVRKYDDRLPIIIESALAMPDKKSRAFELGCDDFITKPFNKEEFLHKIDNLL